MKQYLWMYKYIEKCKYTWFIAHGFNFLDNFLSGLSSAFAFKFLFQSFETRNIDYLYLALIICLADFILAAAMCSVMEYCRGKSSAVIRAEIQKDLLQKVLQVKTGELNKRHSGNLLSILNQDVDLAMSAIDNSVDQIIIPLTLGISYLIITFVTVWQMGLFYLVFITPIIIYGVKFASAYKEAGRNAQERLASYNERFSDILAGLVTIKQYSLEKKTIEIGTAAAQDILDVKKKEIKLGRMYRTRQAIFTHFYATMPIILGCVCVTLGYASLPNVMFNSRYTFRIRWVSKCIINVSTDLQMQMAAIDRLKNVFGYAEEQTTDSTEIKVVDKDIALKVCNLSANYDDIVVLSNIDLDVDANRITAIIGASGSGKSTLLKSLLKFVDYEGSVKLFGNECSNLGVNIVRDSISYVSQEHDLIEGSIKENILYGKMTATDEELDFVCEQALISEFIDNFEEGLDYNVGENGNNLSGGQRQRVAIARALLKDSPIIIFDEATSALDYDLEHRILANIKSNYINKTIIICTHRLTTIESADKIVVIEDGKITESGSHKELFERRGTYHNLLSYML